MDRQSRDWRFESPVYPFKFRMHIHASVELIIDPLILAEQAGFRCRRSTGDKAVLLTQNSEDYFNAKRKAGTEFVNLTAAYYTVWHRGLICTLLKLLPDNYMIRMIMEFIRNKSITLITGSGKQNRLQRLRNGVPIGIGFGPLLYNIYTYDLPSFVCKKYAYVDNLSLLHTLNYWKSLERF